MLNQVAVVGGGPSGLAAAIALHRSGLAQHVHVLEAGNSSNADAVHAAHDAGAAVQITPNGFTALQLVAGPAVVEQVLAASSPMKQVTMILPSQTVLYDNLLPLPTNHTSSSGFPTVMIRWSVLRDILVQQLPAGSVRYNQTVVGYNQTVVGYLHETTTEHHPEHHQSSTTITPAVRLQLQVNHHHHHSNSSSNNNNQSSKSFVMTTTTTEPYSLVVAADGKASRFRSTPLQANPTDPRINFKAVVPQRPLQLPQSDTTAYSFMAPTGSVACFCGPAGPEDGWTYWAVSLPVALYQNQVAAAAATTTNTTQAATTKALLLEICQAYPEAQVFGELISATAACAIVQEESLTAELPASFVLDDNIVLMGNAAHALNDSYGQACSFGWEDAATLVYGLQQQQAQQQQQQQQQAAAATQPQPQEEPSMLAAGLHEYSRLRRDRCRMMQQKSQERAQRARMGDPCTDITQWIHDWNVVNNNNHDPPATNNNNNNKASKAVNANNNKKRGWDDDDDDDDVIMTSGMDIRQECDNNKEQAIKVVA